MSQPVVGRVSKKWSVQLTRRYLGPDGAFGGVVVGSLNPEHLTEFYQSIDLGRSGSISLIGLDGTVRASGGNGRSRLGLGQDLNGTRLLGEVIKAKAGTFVDTGPDGKQIVTFRQVRSLPLAVSVSVNEAQVYAAAYRDALSHSIVGALLTLIIFGVGIKGSRDQLRLRLAKAKLLHSQRLALQKSEHLSLTLDNMGQGIILVTNDNRIPVINRQAVRLLDLPEDFLRRGPTFADFVAVSGGAWRVCVGSHSRRRAGGRVFHPARRQRRLSDVRADPAQRRCSGGPHHRAAGRRFRAHVHRCYAETAGPGGGRAACIRRCPDRSRQQAAFQGRGGKARTQAEVPRSSKATTRIAALPCSTWISTGSRS